MKVGYRISVTYRCNLSCRFCYQLFDRIPAMGSESDITVEEIELGAKMLRKAGIDLADCRLTGGEPLLHPGIEGIHRAVIKHWKPNGWLRICTSGAVKRKLETNDRMRLEVRKPWKQEYIHNPVMISPFDLGREPIKGFRGGKFCHIQRRCGRCFDAFGFSGCPNAPALGRLFNSEVHHSRPTLTTSREICQHCPHSLGRREHTRLSNMVREGVIEYPTATYRWALKKWVGRNRVAAAPPMRFRERVS